MPGSANADPEPPYLVQDALNPPSAPPSGTDFTGDITVATPHDDVRHPNSTTEWWYVNITDPDTGAMYIPAWHIEPNHLAPNDNDDVPNPDTYWEVGPEMNGLVSTVWFSPDSLAESCDSMTRPCAERAYDSWPSMAQGRPLIASETYPPKVTNANDLSANPNTAPTELLEYVPDNGTGSMQYTSPLFGETYSVPLPAYHVYQKDSGPQIFRSDFWLTTIKPGITAPGRIPGRDPEDPFIAWTVPVMTSEVIGHLKPPCESTEIQFPPDCPGTTIELSGWRGYHDHNYGSFDLSQQHGWKGYDWGVAHLPNGDATLMGTITSNSPNVDENGQPDGTINNDSFGFMAEATGSGTRFCQADNTAAGNPTLIFSDPAVVAEEEFPYPQQVDMACKFQPNDSSLQYTGPALRWRTLDPFLIRGPGFSFTEAWGTTSTVDSNGNATPTGSAAWIEHFRNSSNYGCCS